MVMSVKLQNVGTPISFYHTSAHEEHLVRTSSSDCWFFAELCNDTCSLAIPWELSTVMLKPSRASEPNAEAFDLNAERAWSLFLLSYKLATLEIAGCYLRGAIIHEILTLCMTQRSMFGSYHCVTSACRLRRSVGPYLQDRIPRVSLWFGIWYKRSKFYGSKAALQFWSWGSDNEEGAVSGCFLSSRAINKIFTITFRDVGGWIKSRDLLWKLRITSSGYMSGLYQRAVSTGTILLLTTPFIYCTHQSTCKYVHEKSSTLHVDYLLLGICWCCSSTHFDYSSIIPDYILHNVTYHYYFRRAVPHSKNFLKPETFANQSTVPTKQDVFWYRKCQVEHW